MTARWLFATAKATCVGECDGQPCGGRSSAWNDQGESIGALDDSRAGLLILDPDTREVTAVAC